MGSLEALSTFTLLCDYHHHPSPELSHFPQPKPCTHKPWTTLSPCSWKPPFYFCLYELDYSNSLMLKEIIQYLSFYDWLISLSAVRSPSFFYVIACIWISFHCKAEWYSIVCIYHILFSHSSFDGHLGCFHLLAIAKAMYNLSLSAFNSFEYIPRSRSARSTAILFLIFWGTTILSSTVDALFYNIFPSTVHKGSNLSTSSPYFLFFLFVSTFAF